MKKAVAFLFFLSVFATFQAQSNIAFPELEDPIQIIRETNRYQDTLWVMDSSHVYSYFINDYTLISIRKVLSRNQLGSRLTSLDRMLSPEFGIFINAYLDSIVYLNGTDKINQAKTYAWNFDDEKWMDDEYFFVDEDFNVVESYNKGWNINNNEYSIGRQYLYEYENMNRVSTTINQFNPESETWEPFERLNQYQNSLGQDTLRLAIVWDKLSNQWVNRRKEEIFYNSETSVSDVYSSVWDENLADWINERHSNFVITEDSLIRVITYSYWDISGNEWLFEQSNIVTMNEMGRIEEIITMSYDESTSRWVNEQKREYHYEALENESISFIWDAAAEVWLPRYKDYRSFIEEGIVDTTIYSNWDEQSNQWVDTHSRIEVYDPRLNNIESKSIIWDELVSEWKTQSHTYYFWSPFKPTTVDEQNEPSLKVYPNPARDYVSFSHHLPLGSHEVFFELYSLSGQLISSFQFSNHQTEQTVDVSQIPTGIYVYTLHSDKNHFSGKLVIQK